LLESGATKAIFKRHLLQYQFLISLGGGDGVILNFNPAFDCFSPCAN
jgi:hypothetical protein